MPADLYRFVSTKEGATALTRTPAKASSIAEAFVSISRPAFDMQYAIWPGSGFDPLSELIFIMHPLVSVSMSKKNYVSIKGTRKLISITASYSCGSVV